MVHALSEARRVLGDGGLLLDLRPAAVHRRVGVVRDGRFRHVGTMDERFDDDLAADEAIAAALRRKWFRPAGRVRFTCVRAMDRLSDFRTWLEEYVSLGKLPPHDGLVDKLARATSVGRTRIVVRGPVDLRVLAPLR